jgi:hypothetical protein
LRLPLAERGGDIRCPVQNDQFLHVLRIERSIFQRDGASKTMTHRDDLRDPEARTQRLDIRDQRRHLLVFIPGTLASARSMLIQVDDERVSLQARAYRVFETITVISRSAVQVKERSLMRLRRGGHLVPEPYSIEHSIVLTWRKWSLCIRNGTGKCDCEQGPRQGSQVQAA